MWRLLVLMVCVFPARILSAQDLPAGVEAVGTIEGIAEFRLKNGLQVLLLPDDSRPKVTVNITYFVGSRHEGYGEAGMAHLLEHMLFKGTPNHPNIPAALKERGGDFNGTTWVDRTNYYETLPASTENLEFALRLEADRMQNSHVAEADLRSEMTVVRNEFEMGENSPMGILYQRMLASAFEWHNYGKSTIGNRSDIERVPIANLQAFYRRFYQPDNALLIVAGKFEPAAALELVVKYFGGIEPGTESRNTTYTEEPAQDGERSVRLRRVGSVALAGAVYHIPAGGHPDLPAVQVLQRILTTEVSGRLYKSLVQTRLAAEVGGETLSLHDPGALVVLAQAAGDVPAAKLLAALTETVDAAARDGVTAEEVDRARSALLKERELVAADSTQLAIQLSDWAAQGDWRLYFLHRDRLEDLTAEHVTRAAATYLKTDNRTVGLFEPTAMPDRSTIPQLANLRESLQGYRGREAVSAGEQFDPSPENIDARTQRVTLRSGIQAALLPKSTRGNSVTLRLTLRYGTVESLQGARQAAELLPALLMRGTRQLSRQQVDDQLDQLRTELSTSGRPGEVVVSITTRRQALPEVLSLLRQVLREPALPQEEFELLVQSQTATLQEGSTDPQMLATTAVRRKLAPYPANDPRYVPTIPEALTSLKAAKVTQVRQLYERFLGGTNGELAVVGDFDPAELVPAMESLLDGWKSAEQTARIPRKVAAGESGGIEKISTPDKENAIYFAASALPLSDSHPDHAALSLGNFVLGGGGLSSRLADRVRQKDGLSYGVGSALQSSAIDPYSTFYIFAISNPANSPKVKDAIGEELTRLLKDGLTDDEVAKARDGWLQERQIERATDAALAELLSVNLAAKRTMQHHAEHDRQVGELTAPRVLEALRKHLDVKRLFIGMAGDFSKGAGEAKPPAGGTK